MMPIRCGQCQRVLADLDMDSIERMITLRCPGCHARVAIRPAPAPPITGIPIGLAVPLIFPQLTDDEPIGLVIRAPG